MLKKNNETGISFSGCGFLGIYHVGVAACFRQYAPHLIEGKLAGASAGALAAATLLSGCCLGTCTTFILKAATLARKSSLGPLHPNFNPIKLLRNGLFEVLPDNVHLICTGKLYISLTRVRDRKNIIISEFHSKADLIEALLCSSFVPFYCGVIPPNFRGEYFVDGGVSNNLPIFNENTITVSPFSGECDICPTDISANSTHLHMCNSNLQITMKNVQRLGQALFPPHPNILSETCHQGFNDAINFLQKYDYITCWRHLSSKPTFIKFEEINHENLEEENCKDCEFIKSNACIAPNVSHALHNACDSVNKGLFSGLYKTKIYKLAEILITPLFIPFDQLLYLSQTFFKHTTLMPDEFRWFLLEFSVLLRSFVISFKNGGHRYSARFTCQLAVSDLDVPSKNDMKSNTPIPDILVDTLERFSRNKKMIIENQTADSILTYHYED